MDPGHVYHLFVVRSSRRDGLAKHLADRQIETLVHYPVPIPRQPALAETAPAQCPQADKACADVLSLPIHPSLAPAAVDDVARAVRSFGD